MKEWYCCLRRYRLQFSHGMLQTALYGWCYKLLYDMYNERVLFIALV